MANRNELTNSSVEVAIDAGNIQAEATVRATPTPARLAHELLKESCGDGLCDHPRHGPGTPMRVYFRG